MLWAVVALLALQSLGVFCFGSWSAWNRHTDCDTASRAAEYALFRGGTYPNAWLEQPPSPDAAHYTVYPPYVFPLFTLFFEPGGMLQGRFLIEALSLASVVLMGLFAYRVLIPYRRSLAWVGALSGAAIAGNGTALAVGQFSILCVGLIVQQMVFLDRGRPFAAGVCWALAMIKPQIALPFLVLFPMGRAVRGAVFGLAVLATLTAAACQWTEVSPGVLLDHWARGMSLRFLDEGAVIGPGGVARSLSIDHRTIQIVTVVVMSAALVPAVGILRGIHGAFLPVAALCSVCGILGFYHRFYDNIMLYPAIVATLQAAARLPHRVTIAAAIAIPASVLIPKRILEWIPFHEAAQAVVWVFAAGVAFFAVMPIPRRGCDTTRVG